VDNGFWQFRLVDLRRRFAFEEEKQVLNGDLSANTQRQDAMTHYGSEPWK